jgi:vacuolar-type H+-ATPase subunit H
MKKSIRIALIVLVVLFAGIISIPFLFKNKILARVKSEINSNVHATVDFKSFDVSILRSFPNLTLTLEELSIVGKSPFEGDTLAGMKSSSVTVDIMSVIRGGVIDIRSISLDQPRLRLLVNEDGTANWDIMISESDSAVADAPQSQFTVSLKKYSLRDGWLYYDDKSLGFSTSMVGLNHEGDGDFTEKLFTLRTQTDIAQWSLSYEGITYISEAKTGLSAELEMDMVRSKYTFRKNEMLLNELVLGFDGYVAMPGDPIEMDLKFEARQNEFKHFMSMIPGVFREGFDQVTAAGRMSFNGNVKGIYSETTMPGFGFNLQVDDGSFRYPSLPTALNNVQIDLRVSNPDGVPDNTVINLSRLHVELGKEPFDAKLVVKTPVSDADIDMMVRGKVNLEQVAGLVPLEAGTKLSGLIDANLTAKGRMSSIDRKKYEEFNAGGTFMLTGFNYVSSTLPQGMNIPVCELIFNPKNVTLNRFEMTSGKTDIRATGWLDNVLAYTFKENELLKGTLDIRSNVIDLNELMGEPTATSPAADTLPMSVFEVPENIDFLMTASVGKVIYDDLVLENLKGNLAIRDRSLGINGLNFNMLDGLVGLDGLYETRDVKNPYFFLDMNLTGMDIRKTYDKFVAVRTMAPIAEKCSGKYSSSLNVRGNLDSRMEPVYTSLTGGGKLTTSGVTIDQFKPLVKVAEALKMDQFKKVTVSDLNLSYKFENGRVHVAPYEVTLAGIRTSVQGSNGFDQTIDYTLGLKVPTGTLGSQATGVVSGLLAKANQAAGTNLSMGKEVNINVRMTGTVSDPKIDTGIKDAAGSMVTDVKTQIKETFDTKKQELEDKAKAEADRLKQEAEDKAKAEADRLKKEAEDRAKAEADRLKKEAEQKAKKEAEDKLKNLFGKPKK